MKLARKGAATALVATALFTLSIGTAYAQTANGAIGCPGGWGWAGAYIALGAYDIMAPGDGEAFRQNSDFTGQWNERQAAKTGGGSWSIVSNGTVENAKGWCTDWGKVIGN